MKNRIINLIFIPKEFTLRLTTGLFHILRTSRLIPRVSSLAVFIFYLIFFLPQVMAETIFEEYLQGQAAKTVLDNGMTVLIKDVPKSSLVSMIAVVKAGSSTEEEFLGSGISHFVEHMLFKGTEKRKTGAIHQEIESLGGSINGFTSYDYTGYTITVPYEKFPEGVNILADALAHSKFDKDELEKEREVILSEIRLNNDRPDQRIYRLLFSSVFSRHPYQHPVIGYESLFKKLTRDDLLRYYNRAYVPNNIVLVIAGNINKEHALSCVKKEFEGFLRGNYPLRKITPEPEQVSFRFIEEEYPTELLRIFLGYQGSSITGKDMVAMDVLAMILGQGESSRLYQNIYKDKKIVHSIGAFNWTPMDRGIFGIHASLEKENRDKAILAIFEEIEKIKKDKVSEDELYKAKRQVLSSYIFSRQKTDEIAGDYAANEVVTADYFFSEKYIDSVKDITASDIQRAAQKYLNKKSLTLAVLRPKSLSQPKGKEAAEKKEDTANIKKVVLSNGATLLLREDKTHPIVSIYVLFNAGVRVEDDNNNGISNLASQLLLSGTKRYSSSLISKKIETMGGIIDTFSGRNSFGLSLEALSEDLNAGLDVIADITVNSVFPEEEFLQKRENVLAQIKSINDDVFRMTIQRLQKEIFKTHPYRLDYLGTEESLRRIRRDDVIDFYKKFCVSNNMVLAVFGDIDGNSLIPILENKFGKLHPKKPPVRKFEEVPLVPSQDVILPVEKEQSVLFFGFQGVKISDQDRFPLDVLDALFSSSGGRLFKKIREEFGQAYTLGGSSIPGIDTGFYYIYVATTKENINKVRDVVLKEINNLREEDISDEELIRAKTYLIGSQKASLETNLALAFSSGIDELYGLGFDNYTKYEERINSVTIEDVKRIAKIYLDPKKMAVVIAQPK